MRLRVAHGAARRFHVNLLAARDDGAHVEVLVAVGEVGPGGVGAAALRLHDGRAVGGGFAADPEAQAGGVDGEEVDGGAGAGGERAEVLGLGGGEEAGEGRQGGDGLHRVNGEW